MDTTWAVGTLPAGSSASPPEPLRVRVVGLLPTDPYGLKVELTAQWDAAPRRVVPVELGLGTLRGIVADFNLPEHGWTHAPLRVTAVDQWLYGPTFGLASTPGFKYGSYPYGFASGADAVLTSPVILLPPHAILQYDQLVDITFPDTTVYFAGGIIEVSANGGDWQQVTPEGGYPEYYGGETPGWLARPIFAGRIQSGAFHTVRVPLDGLTGAVRIRFHFRAERGSSSGSGWRVDNIRVLSDPTPVRVVAASAVVDGGDVRLSWELAEPLPAFVRWRRGREDETAEAVSGWTPAAVSDMFIDPGAAARAPLRYWLDGKDRDGRVETWGPVEAVTGATSMGWGLVQNPFRGPARFTWSAPLREEATLEIFDVRGRRVVGLHIPAGLVRFDWDGNGEDGRALPAGIYFARFGREPLPPLRLVRLP